MAEALSNRWKVLVSLNAVAKEARARSRREVAYFGDGDTYTAEELTIRAAMLGQLETEIRLMDSACA